MRNSYTATTNAVAMTPVFARLLPESLLFTERSVISEHGNWLGVSLDGSRKMMAPGFDLNLISGDLYLLSIMIAAGDRGKGHGAQLYDLIVQAGRELGCGRVIQTPSGHTPSGETRRSYLFRHGWLPMGQEVFKETGC